MGEFRRTRCVCRISVASDLPLGLLNNKVPLKEVTRVEVLVPQMADFLKANQLVAATPIEPMVGRIVEGGLGPKSVD